MPGFVKTPKDEARWAKAKEAAGKETARDSESYWKLSNYIYHKMGKTEEDTINSKIAYAKMSTLEKVSARNYIGFEAMNKHEQQSILGNEVEHMSDGKKYTAQEAAIAVLKKAGEMLKKFDASKSAPIEKSEQIPAKASEEKDATPPDNVETQVAPENNPKEQAEGNNPDWGTAPGAVKGHIKLAKFCGHMQSKRKAPKPAGAM